MTKTDKEGQRKTPILRFKGFTDDWEQRQLRKLAKLITKGTTPQKYDGNINFIKVENIEEVSINPKAKILESEHLGKLKRSILKENDILFSIAGSLGKVGLVNSAILPANTNQALAIIRLSESKDIEYNYIFNYLRSNYIQHFIRRLPSVGAQPNLSLKQINELVIKFPNYCEQQKISNMLDRLNNILTLYDRKLKLLSQVKKYFLDNLFAEKEYPNLRFKYFKKDKWEKTSLNSIVTYSNGKAHEKEINNKGNLDLVMMNSITTGGRLITKKKILSPQDTLNKNDIVIVLSDIAKGELIGKSSVIPCDNQYVLNQRIGCLHPTLNIDSFFVSKYINQKNRYFKSHAAGTSQINLSRSDVLNCTIYIPKVDEQHCVSNFIINVEKIINFYEYKKRHIIQIKNILLNTMFI